MNIIGQMNLIEGLPLLSPAATRCEAQSFDNLSNELAAIADELEGEEATREHLMRERVINAVRQYADSRYALGKLLSGYRVHWKSAGSWMRVCDALADALHMSSRTVLRIIDDYHRVSTAPVPLIEALESEGISTAEAKNAVLMQEAIRMHFEEGASIERISEFAKDTSKAMFNDPRDAHRQLSPEERHAFNMVDSLRSGLQRLPIEQRLDCLHQIINEIAFLVLDDKSPFTLEITPEPGALTIDGRGRNTSGMIQ